MQNFLRFSAHLFRSMSVSLSTRGRRMPPANTRSIARPYLYGLLASTLAMALAACKSEGLSAAPSEPVVTVQAVAPQSLAVEQSPPGRTVAYMISEVRPQVGGIIQKSMFTECEDVKAGQENGRASCRERE